MALLLMICSLLVFSNFGTSSGEDIHLLVGAYGDHIYGYTLNTEDGKLTKNGEYDVGPNPSFLAWHEDRLYVANEANDFPIPGTGGAGVFEIDSAGVVGKGSSVSSFGNGPCHIAMHQDSKTVFVSNYGSGDFSAFSTSVHPKTVGIGYLKYFENFGSGSHAHGAFWGKISQFVYVTDLGGNKIYQYTISDSDTITHSGTTTIPDGSGPRHMVFHPKLDVAYVALETGNAVVGFNINKENGDLEEFGTFSTLSTDFTGKSYAGGIVIHPKENFLYVTNRGENTIATFSIDGEGGLTLVSSVSCEGNWPRAITLDPTGMFLLVSNQKSGDVKVFALENNVPVYKSGIQVPNASIVAFNQ